jgi:predicted RNA-binding protein (virulence factor B family)
MTQIGKYNTLKVLRKVEFGFYLDGQPEGDILLPLRYAPANCKVGQEIEVFIYLDSEDRLIATTEHPYATVGQFAYLKVASVNPVGAFLDWGLPKDLLVPFREQKQPMEEGKSYVVFIYIDGDTNRIAASAKLSQFLNHEPVNYLPGDEVDLMITSISDLGFKAAINNRHEGVLYRNEVFFNLRKGQKIKGYIHRIRPDGKIDLRLYKEGYQKIDEMSQLVLEELEKQDGFLPLTDKSEAEEIYNTLGISKKNFKQAIGALYKLRMIDITKNGISKLTPSID